MLSISVSSSYCHMILFACMVVLSLFECMWKTSADTKWVYVVHSINQSIYSFIKHCTNKLIDWLIEWMYNVHSFRIVWRFSLIIAWLVSPRGVAGRGVQRSGPPWGRQDGFCESCKFDEKIFMYPPPDSNRTPRYLVSWFSGKSLKLLPPDVRF